MKVLVIVFAVAAIALLVGAFSSGVTATVETESVKLALEDCEGCSYCARECTAYDPSQCYQCCINSGCPLTPSWAICYHGSCEAY